MQPPRRNDDWIRRKFQDYDRRLQAVEGGRRVDGEGGDGLGRPWLMLGQTRNEPIPWQSTTAAAFTALISVDGVSQHPFALVFFQYRITDGATTGAYRVALNPLSGGDPVFFTIGTFSGPNSGISNTFLVPVQVGYSGTLHLAVEAKRNAGTGTVEARVLVVLGCGQEGNPFPVLT